MSPDGVHNPTEPENKLIRRVLSSVSLNFMDYVHYKFSRGVEWILKLRAQRYGKSER